MRYARAIYMVLQRGAAAADGGGGRVRSRCSAAGTDGPRRRARRAYRAVRAHSARARPARRHVLREPTRGADRPQY